MVASRETKNRAVRLLARREHSKSELITKLVSKGEQQEIAESVVAELAAIGAVDDERFAIGYTESRRKRGYGPQKIEFELRQRGVDETLIGSAIRANDRKWNDVLNKVIKRKYGDRPVESFKEWAKRANYLRSKGFPSELVHQTLGRYSVDD